MGVIIEQSWSDLLITLLCFCIVIRRKLDYWAACMQPYLAHMLRIRSVGAAYLQLYIAYILRARSYTLLIWSYTLLIYVYAACTQLHIAHMLGRHSLSAACMQL